VFFRLRRHGDQSATQLSLYRFIGIYSDKPHSGCGAVPVSYTTESMSFSEQRDSVANLKPAN
jgi:hypothetical protein